MFLRIAKRRRRLPASRVTTTTTVAAVSQTVTYDERDLDVHGDDENEAHIVT